ncbi:hypothetical protein CGBL_0114070 [Corynebacterium glutamicum]|nr:hypothetical protein CGBL_0114070 [Corynebacterium glutamicum]
MDRYPYPTVRGSNTRFGSPCSGSSNQESRGQNCQLPAEPFLRPDFLSGIARPCGAARELFFRNPEKSGMRIRDIFRHRRHRGRAANFCAYQGHDSPGIWGPLHDLSLEPRFQA